MVPADVHTLTGAYATDSLTDDERRAFEAHLRACPDCQEEVHTLTETVARLGAAVAVPAPDRLRARVLAQIATTPQVPPQTRSLTEARPGRGGRWLAVAASVALVLAVPIGAYGFVQARQAERVEQEAARVTAIVGAADARLVSGPVAGGGRATVVVSRSGAVLLARGMRALPEQRTYQLWVVRPEQVDSAGLGPGERDAGGNWERVLDGAPRPGDAVAISVEPAGGSAQPSTEPIAIVAV